MFREGFGDTSEFAGFHPIVNLVYYVLAIGITMFSVSPAFLVATLVLAWTYSVLLRGFSVIKINLIISFWTFVIMAMINVIFVHKGVTVLLTIGDSDITLEALIYGVSAACMLMAVIIWFSSFNVIMTSDKLIYIFGKVAPVLGLTLSMVFRYIPLLQNRFREVKLGQTCLGRGKAARAVSDQAGENDGGEISKSKNGFFPVMRQFGKEVSILISWSLESSIESADSMEARGYGLRGRTSFHLYRLGRRDILMLAILLLMGATVVTGIYMGANKVIFYPEYEVANTGAKGVMTLICFVVMLALPLIVDIAAEIKWRTAKVEIK